MKYVTCLTTHTVANQQNNGFVLKSRNRTILVNPTWFKSVWVNWFQAWYIRGGHVEAPYFPDVRSHTKKSQAYALYWITKDKHFFSDDKTRSSYCSGNKFTTWCKRNVAFLLQKKVSVNRLTLSFYKLEAHQLSQRNKVRDALNYLEISVTKTLQMYTLSL